MRVPVPVQAPPPSSRSAAALSTSTFIAEAAAALATAAAAAAVAVAVAVAAAAAVAPSSSLWSSSLVRRWWLWLLWLLVLSAAVPGASAASACSAADPALGLTKNPTYGYYALRDATQLAKVCSLCSSLDYMIIENCKDCTTEVMNSCTTLRSLSGQSPPFHWSLYLDKAPGISSIGGLSNLKGVLPGGFAVRNMVNLTTLNGLAGISNIGATSGGTSIFLDENPILFSSNALSNAKYSGKLNVYDNPKLVCVPSAWPTIDDSGRTIRASGTCPETSPPTPAPENGPGDVGNTGMIVGIVVAAIALAVVGFIYRRRQSSKKQISGNSDRTPTDSTHANPAYSNEHDGTGGDVELPTMSMTGNVRDMQQLPTGAQQPAQVAEGASTQTHTVGFASIQRATNNFDAAHRIGKGGSCVVYKALLRDVLQVEGTELEQLWVQEQVLRTGASGTRTPCAVKVLDQEADDWTTKQFAAEVELLTDVKHPNLVKLYAYSTDGPQKCLVLECMDSALDQRLAAKDKPVLGWQQRVQIAVAVCRALEYLHSLDPPMIHRCVFVL